MKTASPSRNSVLVRKPEELSPLERLGLVDMSFSRLDNYSGCAARYYFTYVQKEDRTFGPAAAMGNIVHAVLEKGEEELNLVEMQQIMHEQREVYDPDHEIGEPLVAAGWQMLVEYADRHAGEKLEVLGREQHFQIVIGSALITGYIDRVDRRSDGLIRVCDYKSGKWEAKEKPWDSLQLGLYALVASKLFAVEEVYAELYYLRSGRRPGHLFTALDLAEVEQRVLAMVRTIIDDRHFHPTQDSWTCRRLCDFGKSGVCPVGRARV